MRIVVDVSPLSHPRTGIGNYIRGSLEGLAAAAGDRHEVVAFGPTSLRGPGRIREALAGIPVTTRLVPLPASHALRTAWSRLGRPSVERFAGELDAFLFSEWMYPAQRRGLRATVFHDLVPLHHPEWCTPRTVSMHTSKAHAAVASCDVVFANSSYTAADLVETLRFDPARIVVAYPGLGPGLATEGPRTDLGGPTHPRARHHRAAKEHRPTGRGVAAARRRARTRARRRRRLGRSPGSRRPAHPEARLRPRGGARLALPWVGGVRLPIAVRRVRDPGDRGDGLRSARGGVLTSLTR